MRVTNFKKIQVPGRIKHPHMSYISQA